MSEQVPDEQAPDTDRLPDGVPCSAAGRDSVDSLLIDWSRERPDLDFRPVGIITRLSRVRTHLDIQVSSVFAAHDLTPADFQVIVNLRRTGDPFRMPQARLMNALQLTSGTVSVRLDRLEKAGIVSREPDPNSARGSLVQLTERGQRLFDQVAPEHLANEDRLLSALDGHERLLLAGLLRRLLASFENDRSPVAADWGLILEPAHLARGRRIAVGLSDRPGLLVAEVTPHSAGALAGLERGDLLTGVDGTPVTSTTGLALQLENLDGDRTTRPGVQVTAMDPTKAMDPAKVVDPVSVTVIRGDRTWCVDLPRPTVTHTGFPGYAAGEQ